MNHYMIHLEMPTANVRCFFMASTKMKAIALARFHYPGSRIAGVFIEREGDWRSC